MRRLLLVRSCLCVVLCVPEMPARELVSVSPRFLSLSFAVLSLREDRCHRLSVSAVVIRAPARPLCAV